MWRNILAQFIGPALSHLKLKHIKLFSGNKSNFTHQRTMNFINTLSNFSKNTKWLTPLILMSFLEGLARICFIWWQVYGFSYCCENMVFSFIQLSMAFPSQVTYFQFIKEPFQPKHNRYAYCFQSQRDPFLIRGAFFVIKEPFSIPNNFFVLSRKLSSQTLLCFLGEPLPNLCFQHVNMFCGPCSKFESVKKHSWNHCLSSLSFFVYSNMGYHYWKLYGHYYSYHQSGNSFYLYIGQGTNMEWIIQQQLPWN